MDGRQTGSGEERAWVGGPFGGDSYRTEAVRMEYSRNVCSGVAEKRISSGVSPAVACGSGDETNSSTIRCAFAPPAPKELMPARRGHILSSTVTGAQDSRPR